MGRLIAFLVANRSTFLFVVLQLISAWLLVSYNRRYNASFFNSSNYLVGSLNQRSNQFSNYFQLEEINTELAKENSYLREQLYLARKYDEVDTFRNFIISPADVIDNSFRRFQNFFTISKGFNDGIDVGMGVISSSGIAGQVKAVSNRFATVYSVLHPNLSISAKVKRTGTICTIQWDQESFYEAKLRYLPRHIKLYEGDSIVTSGFNSIFPEGILIGVVETFELEGFMSFYDARISLATDFTSLNKVYVIKDSFKMEKDSLQAL